MHDDTRSRARHGLAIYFAVLVPLSAAVSIFAIEATHGHHAQLWCGSPGSS